VDTVKAYKPVRSDEQEQLTGRGMLVAFYAGANDYSPLKILFMEHTKPTRSRKPKMQPVSFEVPVNGRSYAVNATPFKIASGEIFYRVSYNNGPVHIFAWDDGLDRFAETDNAADIIPPVIEMAIAERLEQNVSQLQDAA
jgi:hypothetical protein